MALERNQQAVELITRIEGRNLVATPSIYTAFYLSHLEGNAKISRLLEECCHLSQKDLENRLHNYFSDQNESALDMLDISREYSNAAAGFIDQSGLPLKTGQSMESVG